MARDWREYAACQDYDPELWFPMAKDWMTERKALSICGRCPVRDACLTYAIEVGTLYGIWGGKPEDALRELVSKSRAKPPPLGPDALRCPRCHRYKGIADFIGVTDVPTVRCNACKERQRRWDSQRRREAAR